MRKIIQLAIVLSVFLIAFFESTAGQVSSVRKGFGEEWLSWSEEQRARLFGAYLDGYFMGKTNACVAASELFELDKPIHDLKDTVDARCFRHAKGYSRKANEYAAVVTDFYTKHPEYRKIPQLYLLMQMTDDRFKTADELFDAAREGRIRTF